MYLGPFFARMISHIYLRTIISFLLCTIRRAFSTAEAATVCYHMSPLSLRPPRPLQRGTAYSGTGSPLQENKGGSDAVT